MNAMFSGSGVKNSQSSYDVGIEQWSYVANISRLQRSWWAWCRNCSIRTTTSAVNYNIALSTRKLKNKFGHFLIIKVKLISSAVANRRMTVQNCFSANTEAVDHH